MEPWQIVLLIVVVLLFFYVGVLVYVFSMIRVFKSKLRAHLIAMSVLLSEKKEMLLGIHFEFVKAKVKLDKADAGLYDRVQHLAIKALKDNEVAPIEQTLKEAQNRLNFIAQTNPWATKSEDYQNAMRTLHDIDVNFRQAIVVYNSDLNGYNYWIRVPLCHAVAWLFGNRKKAPLN
ncbi:MAG: hypothetical protein BWY98_00523 [Tenericutes bacterium ADurb.BinA155]|jgi:hypothetical protein|nr:MAG: hypothetical protein BWY98_00523 [Tenericutes bacterium ADurb.BinA155]